MSESVENLSTSGFSLTLALTRRLIITWAGYVMVAHFDLNEDVTADGAV